MGIDNPSPRDLKEWRRLRAWDLQQHGWPQCDIAEALSVSEGAVSRWLSLARTHGPEALLARPIPGSPPRLTDDQRRLIPDFLWHGAEAYGFRGEVWTCSRVAAIIEQEFGACYHPGHVARLLKELGWTPQVPIARALQRDDEEIEQWRVAVWPELRRQARREHRTPVFVDEAGFYLLPGVVKTYGLRGLRPVIYEWQSRDHLSVMGGVTPAGKLYTLVRQRPLNGLDSIVFLEHLQRQVAGKLLVIWDGSPIHRSHEVQEYLAGPTGDRRVQLERLPPYAPDLNPQEEVWQHLKHVEMRNLACRDLEELHEEFHLAIARLRQKSRLIPAFFQGAGLEL
jgi:transposase